MRFSLRAGVRVVMGLIMSIWAIFIVHNHVPLTGERVLHFVTGQPHGVIGFWPNQDVSSDSRYFDVLTTVLYDSAQMTVYSNEKPDGDWVVGVRVPPSIWHYRTESLVFQQSSGGYWAASAVLPLRNATRVAEKYTFVMRRTNGDVPVTQLPFTEFDMTLQRESLFATMYRYWFGR